MKYSLQYTHLMVRSGCSESEVVSTSRISSRSDMIRSPGVGLDHRLMLAGHLEAVCLYSKRSRYFPGEHRVERGLPSNRRSGCGKSITMAKLCQGKMRTSLTTHVLKARQVRSSFAKYEI